MKAILFGASGMVGAGTLLECIDDPLVTKLLVVGRTPITQKHAKIEEILTDNFFDYSAIESRFVGYDACLFCLGVSSVGMDNAKYEHLTFDLTIAAAQAIIAASPAITFCYISAQGTDSSEKGRSAWARVKGKTENTVMRMPFKASYMFRPGFIQPMRGIKSKTPVYQRTYDLFGWLLPVFVKFFKGYGTTSERLGRAMIRAAANGYEKRILENVDINKLGA